MGAYKKAASKPYTEIKVCGLPRCMVSLGNCRQDKRFCCPEHRKEFHRLAHEEGIEALRTERSQPMKKEAINIRLLTALLTHYPAISSYSLHRVAPSAARRLREMKYDGWIDYIYHPSTHKYELLSGRKLIFNLLQRARGEKQR